MKHVLAIISVLLFYCFPTSGQISGNISVDTNNLSFSALNGYDIIHLNDCSETTADVGAPQLPVVIKTFVIPWNAKVSNLDVSCSNLKPLERTFVPYPTQQPIKVRAQNNIVFTKPDSTIYNGNNIYPTNHAFIVADYIMMGYRLVKIQFNPIAYDPVTKKIFAKDLQYNLTYEESEEIQTTPKKQSYRRTATIKKLVRSMVSNPQDVDNFSNSNIMITGYTPNIQNRSVPDMPINVINEQIPEYIIITNNVLKDEFQRLADWKTQKGVITIIKCIEDISKEYHGSDLAEKVHAYLTECREKWGDGLYVLLGGDTNIIPTRFYNYENKEFPSDAYYTNLNCDWNSNKNHIYRESDDGIIESNLSFLGRASVENTAEASVFVNKVLAYENMSNTSIDTTYLRNHLAVSAYIGNDNGFLYAGGMTSINTYYSDYPINKYYLFDHYNCNCSEHGYNGTYSSGAELNKNNFLSALNEGVSGIGKFHIVYHMDHSAPRLLGASSIDKLENITVPDVDNLNNGAYQQIFISGGCEPAHFDMDCIAEHYINNPNGGAVAFIGNANNGWSDEHWQYNKFMYELYENGIDELGLIFSKMIKKGYSYYKPSSFVRLHLLGDPEMHVWSDAPKRLEVDVTPNQIINGQNTINVRLKNLPAETDATLCIMKEGEVYISTIISDTIPHSFQYIPKSSGELIITITAKDYYPYVQELPVNINEGNILSISHIHNFDGVMEIGEKRDLNIYIKNNGTDIASNVVATLSTNSPYIDINNSTVGYGNVNTGEIKGGLANCFNVSVHETAPELPRNTSNGTCFFLTMTKNGTDIIDVDTFRIDVLSPKLKISNIKIIETEDGDLIPEQGEIVRMKLQHARLGCPSDSLVNWRFREQDDYSDVTIVNDSICELIVKPNYNNGNSIMLAVYLYSGRILQDSMIINIAEAVPTIDTSQINLNPFENYINFNWSIMGNAVGYNIYRSSEQNGVYVKLNKLPLTTRYFEDRDVDNLSTYFYKFSGMNSSFIEGELSEPIRAWTTFPLTMKKSPLELNGTYVYVNDAHVMDVDLDGQKEIIAQAYDNSDALGSAVVVVKPDGTEPFDIDGNATNFGGFATHSWRADAVPTAADLLGNGNVSIVAPSRSFTEANTAICYSASDNDGNNLPDTLWSTGIGNYVYRGAVVTDIDLPNGRGDKEIIIAKESRGFIILNADGSIRSEFGNEITANYAGLAVADLDMDGYKEIIYGNENNLYVWKHDGSTFLRSPFFTRTGMNLKSSPIVCDFDNDGEKEIIVASRTSTSYIYVINQDGTCHNNFDNLSSNPVYISYNITGTGEGLDHAISVGDINNDSTLEIVSLGVNCVKAWNNSGELILNKEIQGIYKQGNWKTHFEMPMLADVDGDNSMDIVFNSENKIYAIKNSGQEIVGFPLTTNEIIIGNICVSDIDNNNQNEIVALDNSGYIYVWQTFGSKLGWGRSRFDYSLTGEYVSNYVDPLIVTSDTIWNDSIYNNDIYIKNGTFKINSNTELKMRNEDKIIVMSGGTLQIDGGCISNANILIKNGGCLIIRNNGKIILSQYGKLKSEKGASMLFNYSNIEITNTVNN